MGETETRTVETEFTAKDAGHGAVVDRLAGKFEESARKLAELKAKMGEFRQETGLSTLGALGLGYGIGSWIERAREANTEFSSTQKALAGVLAGSLKFEKGSTEIDRYNRSLVLSKKVATDLEEQAARFGMQVGDVSSAYRTTASAAGSLGLTQKQVLQLTESAIATAKRYGVSGEESATAIARALQMGKVKGFDPFDIALRKSIGNMQHLSQAARFEHIQRALQGSTQIAEAMASGIDGSLGRARQTVDELLRDATGPMFKEISTSVAAWAKHLREAKENGKPLIDDIAGKLVTGFKALETTSKFIKDHWLSIGSVFATLKGVDLARQWGGTLTAMGGKGGILGGAAGVAGGGLMGLANSILPVVGALGAFKVGLDGVIGVIEGQLDKSHAKTETAEFGLGSVGTMMAIARKQKELGVLSEQQAKIAQRTVGELGKYGLMKGGSLDQQALAAAVTRLSGKDREDLASKLGIRNPNLPVSAMSGGQFAQVIASQIADVTKMYLAPPPGEVAKSDADRKFAKAPITNIYGGIHIQQKFEDQDPDRVFLRFKSDLENSVARKSMSVEGEVESH